MVGNRVAIKNAYLDEACTMPVVGTVEGMSWRPDWQQYAYVVIFEHEGPGPFGGEFSLSCLEAPPVRSRGNR